MGVSPVAAEPDRAGSDAVEAARTDAPSSSWAPAIAAALVCATIAVMALAVLVFRPERGTLKAMGGTSAAWSVALLMALTLAWYFIASSELQDRWHGAR